MLKAELIALVENEDVVNTHETIVESLRGSRLEAEDYFIYLQVGDFTWRAFQKIIKTPDVFARCQKLQVPSMLLALAKYTDQADFN